MYHKWTKTRSALITNNNNSHAKMHEYTQCPPFLSLSLSSNDSHMRVLSLLLFTVAAVTFIMSSFSLVCGRYNTTTHLWINNIHDVQCNNIKKHQPHRRYVDIMQFELFGWCASKNVLHTLYYTKLINTFTVQPNTIVRTSGTNFMEPYLKLNWNTLTFDFVL